MPDLLRGCCAHSFPQRSIDSSRELGAYEALWGVRGASFRRIARLFREHPGALPSDLAPRAAAQRYRLEALELARVAGVTDLALQVHGMCSYPARLRDALHPVEVLYFQGRWKLLERRCIAIIGTREPTRVSLQAASGLAAHFARAGFLVLSGLAAGIDTAAHTAAIAAGGATAAVLGTALTASYPAGNAPLQRRLAREFLVLSQVPIVRYAHQSAAQNRAFFPERNATLAALAEAIVIVQAGERSGALIPARHALAMGRKVFILESGCLGARLEWPRRLLARGAIRVGAAEEIDARLAQ